MKNIFVIATLTATFVLCSFSPLGLQEYKLKTIVIDAGHGGKDPGCLGSHSEEADVALAIARELGKVIENNIDGVNVVYTRSTDHFVELHERAAIANKSSGDLFISIHCNSGPQAAYGTETYVMGTGRTHENFEEMKHRDAVMHRENSVVLQEDDYLANYDGFDPNSSETYILMNLFQDAHVEKSMKLAEKVENQFKTRVKRKSRGVKRANLLVLWKTAMPSILVETGFLTNRTEESYLNTKQGQEYMASGIYRAVKEYKNSIETN